MREGANQIIFLQGQVHIKTFSHLQVQLVELDRRPAYENWTSYLDQGIKNFH